jgi:hypothetical protein
LQTLLTIDVAFVLAANLGSIAFNILLIRRGQHRARAWLALAMKIVMFAVLAFVLVAGAPTPLALLLRIEWVLLLGYLGFALDLSVLFAGTMRLMRDRPGDPYLLFLVGLLVVEIVWTAQRLAFLALVRL